MNWWWFAGGLYMMELAPENLRLTATYGLILSATVILLGATLGRWIDDSKRLTAARTCLMVQNVSVAICAVILSLYLHRENPEEWMRLATICLVIGFSAVAKLASTGNVIILQKDWIVVITGNDTHMLANMNSILRTIELTTYMLAPALVGQLFTFVGYVWTGVIIACWNLVSVCIEYLLLELIYRTHPELASKEFRNPNQTTNESKEDSEDTPKRPAQVLNVIQNFYQAWKFYFQHPVRNAGLGLALLYMTVLGFDNITYGYILTQRIPESVLGILVGGSALIGVLGSMAYPQIKKRIGMERTGLFGMFFLVSTSSLSVASLFLPGSPFLASGRPILEDSSDEFQWQSVATLLTGIIAARFGLWITDLTITQIIQEHVEEESRGTFNGVQDSLNNSLDLLKCVLVIFLPQPEQFGILVLLSYVAICCGWVSYALYSRQQRGHLFHFCRLVRHFSAPEVSNPKGTPPTNSNQLKSLEQIEELEHMI
eukprot:TCALIF_10264-PA protein Name:"Similar to SLC40A1 Solute carrier family 40 member 1 (Homo sapiens)" AED:0.13 eAED:0.13 QI:0/0/0/0.85/1/1/7/0/485